MGVLTPLFFALDGRLPPDAMLSLTFTVDDIYCFGFVMQFSCAAIAIRDRLHSLRKAISSRKFLCENEVYCIIGLYEKLFMSMQLVNQYLTVQIIPMFGYQISSLTFSMYSIVRSYLKNVSMKYILTISNGCWVVVETYVLIIAMISGSSTSEEAERIHDVGYEILKNRKVLSPICKEDFRNFVDSKRHSSCTLHSKFFDINWRLMFSVSIY